MRRHDKRGSFCFYLYGTKVEVGTTWPPMLAVRAQVAKVNVRQLVTKSTVTTWLIQFGVDAYSHLPSAATTIDRSKSRIGRRQRLEVHSNSIMDSHIVNGALQPARIPRALKMSKVVQFGWQIWTVRRVQSIDQHHRMHRGKNQHRASIFLELAREAGLPVCLCCVKA